MTTHEMLELLRVFCFDVNPVRNVRIDLVCPSPTINYVRELLTSRGYIITAIDTDKNGVFIRAV